MSKLLWEVTLRIGAVTHSKNKVIFPSLWSSHRKLFRINLSHWSLHNALVRLRARTFQGLYYWAEVPFMYFWLRNRRNGFPVFFNVSVILFYRPLHVFSELRTLNSFDFDRGVFAGRIRSWKFDSFYFDVLFHGRSFVRKRILILSNNFDTSFPFSIDLSASIVIPTLLSFWCGSFNFTETIILPTPFFGRS